jgi:hypothetical protein
MHLPAKLLALVAMLVCAAALVASAGAEPTAKLPGSHPCRDIPSWYVNGIRVRDVTCPKAEQVITRYTRLMNKRLQHDWDLNILGFRCDLTGKDFYGDSHRCTAGGGRAIVFRRGTHA